MKIYGPVKISKKLTNIMHSVGGGDHRLRYLYSCCRTKNPSLITEIGNLIREYTDDYPICILNFFNNTGLCSHVKACDIVIGGKFKHNKTRYSRLPNPFGPHVVDGKIGAMDSSDNIVLIDVDQQVRPVINGCLFKTPGEVLAEDKLSLYRDCAYSDMDNKIVEFIKSKSGMLDSVISYSAYKNDENDVPIDNLDEVAVDGSCVFVCDTYQSPVVQDPTWLVVCLFAEYMIRETEDYHHVFLEGVYKSDREVDGVPVYGFNMGS